MLKLREGKIKINNHTILDNINLDIEPSLLTVIIGPNGAGKTSLINVLAGSKKLANGKLSNTYKKSILIPQRAYYPEGITLYDYISSIFYQKGWRWGLTRLEKNRIFNILEKLNLSSKKNLLLNQLSAGELQLANVALCLVSGADFILLDEPSANLDLLNQIMILAILKKLTQKEITILAIMHDINLAAKYGERFIVIARDGDLLYGDRKSVLNREVLSKAYNVDFNVVESDENIFIQPNI